MAIFHLYSNFHSWNHEAEENQLIATRWSIHSSYFKTINFHSSNWGKRFCFSFDSLAFKCNAIIDTCNTKSPFYFIKRAENRRGSSKKLLVIKIKVGQLNVSQTTTTISFIHSFVWSFSVAIMNWFVYSCETNPFEFIGKEIIVQLLLSFLCVDEFG